MLTTTKLPGVATLVITAIAVVFGASGCMSEFQVQRARLTDDGKLKITDPEPVPLPRNASTKIGVYWKERGQQQLTGVTMPERPYEVIGRVHGVVGYAWQTNVLLENQFRRAAAAIGGDAVINAKRNAYEPKGASNEYTGHVIKWKPVVRQDKQ